MKRINKRILMLLIVLIFFTSLGSVVAYGDDVSLDDSVDSIGLAVNDDVISEDISTDIEISDDDFQSMEIIDENNVSDEIVPQAISDESPVADVSSTSVDEESFIIENQDKKANSKGKLSSLYDSGIISINNVILTKSQSSSNLLSSPQIIVINDSSSYDGSINVYIQKLIDDAVAGSTIQFAGSSYENIYLKISKPLNIISKSGTRITNIFDVPVFTILAGGSGTNISGFTVNLAGSFVDASDVSNIHISGNKISTKRNGITFREVYDSSIKGNVFSNFKIAMDISKSGGIDISKNNITPAGGDNIGIKLRDISSKKGISILNNNIIASDRRNTGTGIYFDRNASNVLVKGNAIRKWFTAMEFPYSINNVSIINNTISDNGDGVIINGWIENFTFNKNIVTGNSRVGVLFDDYFLGTKGDFAVENNYFSSNSALDLQNKGDAAVSIGKNFANKRCARVGMKYGLNIRTRQEGSKYFFSVVDRNGNAVKGLPNFSGVMNINGRSYNVNFIDSVAYIDTGSGVGSGGSGSLNVGGDNRNFGDWGQYNELGSGQMDYYEQFYNELLKSIMGNIDSHEVPVEDTSNSEVNRDYNPINNNNHENQSSSSSRNGRGSGDSGVSTGSNSINSNGLLSGSSGSAGASPSSASSASATSGQSGAAAPESVTAKTLSVDEETFRVIGVGGLVLLIILVIGLYYREDIKDMME